MDKRGDKVRRTIIHQILVNGTQSGIAFTNSGAHMTSCVSQWNIIYKRARNEILRCVSTQHTRLRAVPLQSRGAAQCAPAKRQLPFSAQLLMLPPRLVPRDIPGRQYSFPVRDPPKRHSRPSVAPHEHMNIKVQDGFELNKLTQRHELALSIRGRAAENNPPSAHTIMHGRTVYTHVSTDAHK